MNVSMISPGSLISGLKTEPIGIGFPFKNPKIRRDISVVGSCNGLVCISIGKYDLFLWNPCTRVYNKLSSYKSCYNELDDDYESRSIYGFGYNESDDDYKVFKLTIGCFEDLVPEVVAYSYSTRTNSWKRVGDFKERFPLIANTCLFVGKFHFRTCPKGERYNRTVRPDIVSFDLGNEVYQTIEQPDYGEGDANHSWMGVFNGCICVLWQKKITCADLWVMNEYGVKESWSKTDSIPYYRLERHDDFYWYTSPLVMLPSGEILLAGHCRVVVYNPKDKSSKWISRNMNLCFFVGACVYVESLVSPQKLSIIDVSISKGRLKHLRQQLAVYANLFSFSGISSRFSLPKLNIS